MNSTIVGLIVGVVLVIITIILIFWGRGRESARQEEDMRYHTREAEIKPPAVNEQAVPMMADDLTLVEGIGPKIAEILKKSGISSFAQLAAADTASLAKLLQENGLQFTKPDSWPEQARLAAEGKMDDLKALQERLVAGR